MSDLSIIGLFFGHFYLNNTFMLGTVLKSTASK